MSGSGKTCLYIRVSTEDQNTARQYELVDRADRVFEEKMSGEDMEHRPELKKALGYLRDGDTLMVWSIDRLTRSFSDLDRIIKDLRLRGVSVEFVSERMSFPASEEIDPWTEAMLYVLGVFAQLERRMKSVASREGIAIAKAEGRYKGRKPVLTNADVLKLKGRAAIGVPKAKLAREFDISRDTVYRVLAGQYETAEAWAEATSRARQDKKANAVARREKANA